MAAYIKIKSSDALAWAHYLGQVEDSTPKAVADAINDYGAGVADMAAEVIAGQTGLDPHEIRALIDIEEATPSKLVWRMDATAIAPPPQDWERPWNKRSDAPFSQQTLVKIESVGDHLTCEVCEEAEANSPYTMDEINEMAAKWQHWEPPAGVVGERTNLVHPNCRCTIMPWKAEQRKMSLTFGGKGAPPELLNARQLGAKVADQLKVTIRALKK